MSLWTLKLIKIEFYDLSGIVNIQLLIDFLLDRYYNTFDIFLNSFPPIDRHKIKRVTNHLMCFELEKYIMSNFTSFDGRKSIQSVTSR